MSDTLFFNPYRLAGNVNFTVSGVDFPGSATGWLERDADLTGNADGKLLFFSFWIDPDSPTSSQQLWSTGGNEILLRITSSEVNVIAENAAGTISRARAAAGIRCIII